MTGQEAMIDIGNGVALWLHSMGHGSPAIILEAPGPGCDSQPWAAIQSRLAQWTRTCRHDRAGTGRSGGTELSMPAIPPLVQDLESLLEAASIEPSYIMVGYSLGGAIVLRYARQHPDHMAGLVLIESATESILPQAPGAAADTAPDGSRLPSFGDIPLAVITIDTQEYVLPPMPDVRAEEAMQVWLAAQAGLAALSTRGRQVFVTNTNHYGILESHAEDVIRVVAEIASEAGK